MAQLFQEVTWISQASLPDRLFHSVWRWNRASSFPLYYNSFCWLRRAVCFMFVAYVLFTYSFQSSYGAYPWWEFSIPMSDLPCAAWQISGYFMFMVKAEQRENRKACRECSEQQGSRYCWGAQKPRASANSGWVYNRLIRVCADYYPSSRTRSGILIFLIHLRHCCGITCITMLMALVESISGHWLKSIFRIFDKQ